jgi:hypothetical protein
MMRSIQGFLFEIPSQSFSHPDMYHNLKSKYDRSIEIQTKKMWWQCKKQNVGKNWELAPLQQRPSHPWVVVEMHVS